MVIYREREIDTGLGFLIGTITESKERIRQLSRSILTEYVKAGLLERSRHGVYVLSNSVHDDMCTLMMRSKKICLNSFRQKLTIW